MNDITPQILNSLSAVNSQIERLNDTANDQGVITTELRLKDGSWPLIPLLSAKAQLLNALAILSGPQGMLVLPAGYDTDSVSYQEAADRFNAAQERPYIPAPGPVLFDGFDDEEYTHIKLMCERDAQRPNGLTSAVVDRRELLIMITNILSWCNHQDSLSKGESMTTAQIRDIIRNQK